LTDGKLVSGRDGLIHFTGLQPELQYRLTETKAKEGYQLLGDYAYVGSLCADKDFTVSLRVVNAKVFTLPETGSNALTLMPIGLMLCAAVCMGALFVLKKKEI
jgi:LPXTG-motif cell wall-anchored protein